MSPTETSPTANTLTWLSPREAAEYLRLNWQTLANYRVSGTGPRFSRIGRVVRYRRADLDEWLESASEVK